MTRYVRELLWARPCSRPAAIPIGRPRGAKAQGLRYERALARELDGKHGQWFEFEDANGRGWCQTDLLLGRGSMAVVLECKYTWTLEGHLALAKLYLPVVQMALQRPTCGLVVCKKLVPDVALHGVQICSSLEEALMAAPRRCVAWHWTGVSALVPHTGDRAPRTIDTIRPAV